MVWYDRASAAVGRFRACLLETGGWVTFAFIVFAVQYFLCLQTGRAIVSVEIESSLPATFKVYWRHHAGAYQESHTVAVSLTPGRHRYALIIPSLLTLSDLRIDPIDRPGMISIRGMSIRQPLYLPVVFDFRSLMGKRPAMQGLAGFNPDHDGGVTLTSATEDPWFIVETEGLINTRTLAFWVAAAVIAGLSLNVLLHSTVSRGSRRSGILQVELPEDPDSCPGRWFEDLTATMPGLHLHRTTERAGWRIYQFAFVRVAATDLETMIDTVQQHYPCLRLHLQLNRSGEVN
jgi:hypothetical protein